MNASSLDASPQTKRLSTRLYLMPRSGGSSAPSSQAGQGYHTPDRFGEVFSEAAS